MAANLKLRYFGTSGIRGRTFVDVTPGLAERMARAYADVVLSGITRPLVVIGRDPRYGAESIEAAIIAGLTASGVSVLRCGIVPTPVLLTYQRYVRADGAILITGSHIPPDRIGLIFMEDDGAYCSDYMAFTIEQRFEEFQDSRDGLLTVNSIGDLIDVGSVRDAKDVWEVYEDLLQSLVDLTVVKSRPFRVVVDPGNGTAAQFFSAYLGRLGLDVTAINDYPAPLSSRLSEPIDDNLDRLKELVQPNVDLGIAFDLDADRVNFVVPTKDGEGRFVNANVMGAFMLRELLESGRTGQVVLPINTSNIVGEVLEQYGIEPIYCKIGQPGTIEQVKKLPKPLYSFEESGKAYFLSEGLLWTDGLLMALQVLEVMARKDKSLEELVSDLPQYYSLTRKVNIPDHLVAKVRKKLPPFMRGQTFENEKSRVDLDGVRVDFTDRSWLLVRPSGTEPKIRVVADAKTQERAEVLLDRGETAVQALLAELGQQSQ